MKMSQTFCGNNSFFIAIFPHKPKDIYEIKNLLFPDKEWNDVVNGVSVVHIVDNLYYDIKTQTISLSHGNIKTLISQSNSFLSLGRSDLLEEYDNLQKKDLELNGILASIVNQSPFVFTFILGLLDVEDYFWLAKKILKSKTTALLNLNHPNDFLSKLCSTVIKSNNEDEIKIVLKYFDEVRSLLKKLNKNDIKIQRQERKIVNAIYKEFITGAPTKRWVGYFKTGFLKPDLKMYQYDDSVFKNVKHLKIYA